MQAECWAAKLSACSQLGDDQDGDPGAERRDQRRSAAPRSSAATTSQPCIGQPAEPAPLRVEPDDLDDHAHRPEHADRALAVAERGQVQRIERVEAGVRQHGQEHAGEEPRDDRLAQQRQGARRRASRAAPPRPTAGTRMPATVKQHQQDGHERTGRRPMPAACRTKPLTVTAPTKPTEPHMRTRP